MSNPVTSSWTLTLDEEFNGSTLDTTVWHYNKLAGEFEDPWNSNEDAGYDASLVTVSGGVLHLDSNTNDIGGESYSTGAVSTDGLFTQQEGYYEARINLPGSGGDIYNFPAFWLNGDHTTWPDHGEIDIFEGIGGNATSNYHSPTETYSGYTSASDFTGWHTFGMLWEDTTISFYYDNNLVSTYSASDPAIVDFPGYIVIDNAIDGDSGLGGPGGFSHVGEELQVDWVHVYSAPGAGGTADAYQAEYSGPGGTGALPGTSGADTIVGTSADEFLTGLQGNDSLKGGGGHDTLDGGSGVDTADYSDKTTAVVMVLDTVNYATVTVNGVAEDFIKNTENVTGGSGADDINGDTANNTLFGGAGADLLQASSGDDFVKGGLGDDTLNGGNGSNDTADYRDKTTSVSVTLNGGNYVNVTVGGVVEDTVKNCENFYGGSVADTIVGDTNANTLQGLGGIDTLTGSTGADSFSFNTTPGTTNADHITDFSVVDDTIIINNGTFTAAGVDGTLASAAFYSAAGAVAGHDADDRIVYNSTTGALYYDADGSGAGASLLFATLDNHAAITNADILIA